MPEVPKVTDADLAFPANVKAWLPTWEDIPEEFKRGSGPNMQNPYVRLAATWFYDGLDQATMATMTIRDGFSLEEAIERKKRIQACLGSWQPKHEHKMAGVGYLLSQLVEIKVPA